MDQTTERLSKVREVTVLGGTRRALEGLGLFCDANSRDASELAAWWTIRVTNTEFASALAVGGGPRSLRRGLGGRLRGSGSRQW